MRAPGADEFPVMWSDWGGCDYRLGVYDLGGYFPDRGLVV